MNEQLLEALRPFARLVAEELVKIMPAQQPAQPAKQYRGIDGIAEIFQCSRSKAAQLKASGILDGAITTTGRVFLVDEQKALAAVNENNRKFRKYN